MTWEKLLSLLIVSAFLFIVASLWHDRTVRCANNPSELAGQIEACRQRGGTAIAAPVVVCGRAYLKLSECQLGPTR